MSIDLTQSVDKVLEAARTASQEDLKAALTAEADGENRKGVIDGLTKLVEPNPNPEKEGPSLLEDPALKGLKSITVHTNPEKVVTGGAYYDPLQKVTIRADAVTVKRTKFITDKLASGELVED